jgi:hypothetical protein
MRSSHRLQRQSFLPLAVSSLAGARHFTDSGHGNFARWFRDSVNDDRGAEEITKIEWDKKTSAEEGRRRTIEITGKRYARSRRDLLNCEGIFASGLRNSMNESEGNLNAQLKCVS